MTIIIEYLQDNWQMVLLEAFGYLGTALVLLSMMMTSVTKLRIVNVAGSVVSMTYAAFCSAWPVVFLNFGLIIINVIQLVRLNRLKSLLKVVHTSANDANVKYFIEHYLNDIKLYFPDFELEDHSESATYIVYDGAEAIGILIGEKREDEISIALDYVSQKYRDRSVARYLFNRLKDHGIKTLTANTTEVTKHNKYLVAMGFAKRGERMVKEL